MDYNSCTWACISVQDEKDERGIIIASGKNEDFKLWSNSSGLESVEVHSLLNHSTTWDGRKNHFYGNSVEWYKDVQKNSKEIALQQLAPMAFSDTSNEIIAIG